MPAIRGRTLSRQGVADEPLDLTGGIDPCHPRAGQLSRRSFLAAGVGGLAGVALAACGSSTSTGTTRPSGVVITSGPPGPGPISGGVYGGTVTVGWVSEANSLDPALGYNYTAWDAITCLLNTPLLAFSGEYGGPAPALAAALPAVSKDGLTYTIKLRPGAKFSNGRAIVADDYLYSWTRVLDPKVASWASSYLLPIDGSDKVAAGRSKSLSGVVVLDSSTLEIHLSAPTFTFVNQLAQPYMAAVPREAVQQLGSGFNTQPVGTGPFMVSNYSTGNQTASFARNPHFDWKGLPYLQGVNYHWGLNSQLELLQLQQGDIAIIGDGIGPSLAAQVAAQPSLARYADPVKVNAMSWIALNNAKGPLADVRVRQALNWAVDREALARVAHGTFAPSGYPLPSSLADYHRVATPYGLDTSRAKSLLAEAGVSSFSMRFATDGSDPWPEVIQILQQQYAPLGINIKIDTMSTSAYDTLTTTTPLATDSFQDEYSMIQPSALDLIIPNYTTTGSYNSVGYSSSRVDALVTKAQAATTLAGSNVSVAEIEQQLVNDAPSIFLFDTGFIVGRSPKLQNYQYRGETGTYYNRLWL